VLDQKKKEFKKRIYSYVLRLVRFLGRIPDNTVARELKGQLTRSGTSVGANYFEAQAASSKKDFLNFFRHALKSANESRFWLALLRDGNFLPEDLVEESRYLIQETKELANIFASSIITMKSNQK
jgi:four helix bundle protein